MERGEENRERHCVFEFLSLITNTFKHCETQTESTDNNNNNEQKSKELLVTFDSVFCFVL